MNLCILKQIIYILPEIMKIVVLTSDSAADRAVELTGVEIETQHANNHKSVLCRPGNLKNNVIKTSNNDDLRFWWQYFSIHPLRNSCFSGYFTPSKAFARNCPEFRGYFGHFVYFGVI